MKKPKRLYAGSREPGDNGPTLLDAIRATRGVLSDSDRSAFDAAEMFANELPYEPEDESQTHDRLHDHPSDSTLYRPDDEHPLHLHNPARVADLMGSLNLPEEALQDPKTEKWLADHLEAERAREAQYEDDGLPTNPQPSIRDSLNQWYGEEKTQHSGLQALRGELSKPNPDPARLAHLHQTAAPTLLPRDRVTWQHVGKAIHMNRYSEAAKLVRKLQNS